MTTTQELLKSSFELNLNNYGPEDVERLNDWAIKAYAALETAQAENAQSRIDFKEMVIERNAELARLAEIENQEPAYLLTPDGKCYAYGSAQPLSAGHADATLLKLYASAGASPVEPNQAQPGDTAITYMTGYSDGREWAGATSQAQPERAPLSDEQKRILFECVEQVKDGNELDYYLLGFEAAENAYGIKQGGQQCSD